MKISVFGTGYVGLVTGICFAEVGHQVFCVDVDEQKISMLNNGQPPIYEPGLEEMLNASLKAKRIMFSTDIAEAVEFSDLIFIAVGTPQTEDGSADLSAVKAVAKSVGQHMRGAKTIVIKSTVPMGTHKLAQDVIFSELKQRGVEYQFEMVSNPEFLREGAAIEECLKPNRVVVGCASEEVAQLMTRLYTPFLNGTGRMLIMDLPSAEMTKYAANAMLATKISFMNELSRLCEKVGADIESVRTGIGTDHRIGPHFIYAGVGYGGSCLPKDVRALIKTGEFYDENLSMLKEIERVNAMQRKRFLNRILRKFNGSVAGKSFAFWGVAFKPGTDDIRDAPAIYLIEELLGAGATIKAYDPVAAENTKRYFSGVTHLHFVEDQYDALIDAEALVIPTEWKYFKEPDFERLKTTMKNATIFDGRNIYNPALLKNLGIEYFSIGR